MKLKVGFSIFLFMVSNSFCFSQDVINSPYHVGFEYYKTFDETRKYALDKDTTSRPLLIHFWYPSDESVENSSYYFKNYIDLISLREDFNKPTSEVEGYSYNFIDAYAGFAKQNFGVDTSLTTQEILDFPIAAQYGVALAKSKEKFPLIIYAPSNSKSAVQNHMLCEYLASHGFMVISVGSAGKMSLDRNNLQESILAQVNDMEFMLNYFEDSLKINYAGLGLMGFSSGGLATTIFQMKHENVNAVFSLDGGQEYGAYVPLFKLEDFDLNKTNVPYCLLVNNYENFSIYPFYNSIISEEKRMFRMPYIDHNGFVSCWRFFDFCSAKNSISKFCTSYDYISSAALAFFNAYLKPKQLANCKSELSFQTNEYIKTVTSDNSTIAQLCNLIISDGIDSAINFLDSHQEVFSEKESEINILSKMFRDADTDEAIQLLLFNKKMHTDSWQTQFELGFTYKLKGDLSLAKEYILKAQELNPENSEIISLLNEINEAEE